MCEENTNQEARYRKIYSAPTLTMGLLKKGNPCMACKAFAASFGSSNTTQACPLNLYVLLDTTSTILPNWLNIHFIDFFKSAVKIKPQNVAATS